MKKFVLAFSILLIALKLSAQITFVGFDQPICGAPMTNTYSYNNYPVVGGPSTSYAGFKIYRNGVMIQNWWGYQSGKHYCDDLIFINDSTGFFVEHISMGQEYVYKTSDFGNTWIYIGGAPMGYLGLYLVNINFAYLVTLPNPNTNNLFVSRCSDIDPPVSSIYFINDVSINADIYKTDTIIRNSLCNIDSLNIFVKNSLGDTIDYHINLFYVPLGVNELQQPLCSTLFIQILHKICYA